LLHLFMGIYQVGYSSASRWIAQGHRTLEDLKTKADLTPNQRIGVEHYDDFLQRIPRAEVLRHAEVVGKVLRDVDPKLQAIVGGSYRRGNTDSGDIDMLITKEGASLANIRTVVLGVVVPLLTKQGFLKAALAAGTARADSGSKWHGASALPGSNSIWRRIDLLFVPWNEVGAALIYFTGNDIFNRSMRLLASKKGMRLNQRGLYADVMRGQRRERITEGKLLEGQSEEKIFDLLGVPWRPPEHRKC
jgi:DNA polymerase IV